MALIGLNVQHDANHGAASRKVWVNDLLGLGADFIGGCKWLWMEKHWTVRYIGWSSHELVVLNKSQLLTPSVVAQGRFADLFCVVCSVPILSICFVASCLYKS